MEDIAIAANMARGVPQAPKEQNAPNIGLFIDAVGDAIAAAEALAREEEATDDEWEDGALPQIGTPAPEAVAPEVIPTVIPTVIHTIERTEEYLQQMLDEYLDSEFYAYSEERFGEWLLATERGTTMTIYYGMDDRIKTITRENRLPEGRKRRRWEDY